ncbi:MAG: RecQ family ATP-dependent DNA helicase [Candidatus Poribacteria bacterium]|nr:RecQ family ATP-dependent DNA helicase [Candidatus Poribacteria bacterium]
MKVLIVAKTRMGSGACIGAITEDGKSVRLIPYGADPHDGANREYEIGDVWEICAKPASQLAPPHTEDIVVYNKNRLREAKDLIGSIERFMPSMHGSPFGLYEGLLQTTGDGALYVTEKSGIPLYSTTFWRPDVSLERNTEGRRIHYCYPTKNGGCTFAYVGFEDRPLEVIPKDTLLRISLARPWRPKDRPNDELRCHAQISGWLLTDEDQRKTVLSNDTARSRSQTTSHSPSKILQDVFGHSRFRSLQEEIVDHILDGYDAFIVLPTGGGKSLCFQLPALIFDGVTVVISPLISLMEDQVMKLQQRKVGATFLNHTVECSEYVSTMQRVKRGEVKLLYMAPETLMRPEILLMLDESNVSCLAIDEAHCISQWGHDFRPEYRELVSVRRRFSHAVCLALTATATPRVQEDIRQLLCISEESQFVASFDRGNLFLAVEPKVNMLEQSLAFLNKHRGDPGIIYCQTREQVESLAHEIARRGIPTLPYHAGLDSEIRSRNQDAFITGEIQVIVATIAFGMGIDKEDVRFVLHTGLPKEPESYYQEIGRAGRDGEHAECLLLFGWADMDTIRHFIDQGTSSEHEGRLDRLNILVDWALSNECRRKGLLAYFGERYENESCGRCDNCRKEQMKKVDLTTQAQQFLSCAIQTGEIFGESHIVNVLRGSKSQKVINSKHDRLSTYGIGSEHSKEEWRHVAFQLVQFGLLNRDSQHGSLRTTDKGRDVINGDVQFLGLPWNSATRSDKNRHSLRGEHENGKRQSVMHTMTNPLKLYDIPSNIEETLLMPEDEEFDGTQFEKLGLTFDEKIHNCAAYIKNIRAQQKTLDAHIEILQEEMRALQGKREELENNRKGVAQYIKGLLESLGLEKAGNSIHRVRIARSPLTVEVDMEKLESTWIKRTENVYADKRGIIEHIKKTDETPDGVRRIENTHLRVS